MHITYWIIDLLIPLAMIILGRVFWKKRYNGVSYLSGYRTSRSMKSKESFEYANRLFGQKWFKLGILLGIIVIIDKLALDKIIAIQILSIVNIIVGLFLMLAPCPSIERELKKKFN